MAPPIATHTFESSHTCHSCKQPLPKNADEAMRRIREHNAWQLLRTREAHLFPSRNIRLPKGGRKISRSAIRDEIEKLGFVEHLDALEAEFEGKRNQDMQNPKVALQPRAVPTLLSGNGWGQFTSVIGTDDKEVMKKANEESKRIGLRPEFHETYTDQHGRSQMTVHQRVSGFAPQNQLAVEPEVPAQGAKDQSESEEAGLRHRGDIDGYEVKEAPLKPISVEDKVTGNEPVSKIRTAPSLPDSSLESQVEDTASKDPIRSQPQPEVHVQVADSDDDSCGSESPDHQTTLAREAHLDTISGTLYILGRLNHTDDPLVVELGKELVKRKQALEGLLAREKEVEEADCA